MTKYEKAMLKAAEDKMKKYQNLYYDAEQEYYDLKEHLEKKEREEANDEKEN